MGPLSQLACLHIRLDDMIAHPPQIIYVFLLIVFLELEESVQRAPTIRLLESAICSQYYHDTSAIGDIKESMCKTPPIQSKLAHTRGALSLFDALPGLTAYNSLLLLPLTCVSHSAGLVLRFHGR